MELDVYRTVVSGLDQGVLLVDRHGTVLAANGSAERILGFDCEHVCGGSDAPWTFLDDDGAGVPAQDLPCQRSLRTGEAQLGVVLGVARADATFAWVEFNARPTLHRGSPVAILTFSDVTASRVEQLRLRELASADASLYAAKESAGARSRAAARRAGHFEQRMARAGQILERLGATSRAPFAQDIVAATRELLDMDLAYYTRHTETEQQFQAVSGDHPSFGVDASTRIALEQSYCHHILEGRLPNLMPDVAAVPVAAALPVTGAAGVGAYVSVPITLADGELFGTLCCAAHAARPDLTEQDLHFLRLLARLIADRLQRECLVAERAQARVISAALHALVGAVNARDHYTGEHSETVRDLVTAVARRIGLDLAQIREAEQVALLHDVGKIAVPDAVLHKPAPLDAHEWEIIRTHPEVGAQVVAAIPELAHLADAIHSEHERWDGGGYPRGLRGADIPMASRIVFVCDAFCAMTTDRPYRLARSREAALSEIARGAGTQFCPDAAAALIAEVGEDR